MLAYGRRYPRMCDKHNDNDKESTCMYCVSSDGGTKHETVDQNKKIVYNSKDLWENFLIFLDFEGVRQITQSLIQVSNNDNTAIVDSARVFADFFSHILPEVVAEENIKRMRK